MVSNYVPKFSYIIPFKFKPDRILPLKRVIDWLSGFQGVEIIIVEQDTHSKIDYLNLKATHVFIQSNTPFNKSWAYNVGLRRAQSSIVIFGDADFIMNPMELIESLQTLENFDCVIPTNKVQILSPQESSTDTTSIVRMTNFTQKKNMLDGISLFKKEAILKIAGWNEDLIGLGYENQFNEMKIKQMLTYKQLEYGGFHLFHQPEFLPQQLEERNKQIYNIYKQDKNSLKQHIDQTYHKIGTMNRFSTFTP